MAQHAPVIDDADDLPPPTDGLDLRRPDIPVTLGELAALKGEALEIIDTRVVILETLRKAAIRATSPQDHVLFKAPNGEITAYLQDAGAQRVRDIFGIEIYDLSAPEKITTNDPAVFSYIIRGSGRCKITRQVIEDIEGGRSSTDDFCKGKTGLELELAVRKAARANLDGQITRALAGLKAIAIEDLKAAWTGTTKSVEHCHQGRGFGSRDERLGGVEAADLGLVPPNCNVCGKPMQLRKGSKGEFYSCPDWKAHGRDAHTWDLSKWREQPASRKPVTAAAAPTPAKPGGKTAPPPVDDVFNGKSTREPGQEG